MNLEEMQTALRRFGFDKSDPLTLWLNAAMHDLEDSFDWPWLESPAKTVKTAAGGNEITLPEDALKVIGIRDTTNKRKLEYWDRRKFMREIEDPTEIGLPEIFTLIDTYEVQIWRVLQSEVTFEVLYQGKTFDLVNPEDKPKTENRLWPLSAGYPIVLKAAAIALQAENEEERAKAATEQYEKMLENLRRKFGERELGEPATVEDAMGYGSGVERVGEWW